MRRSAALTVLLGLLLGAAPVLADGDPASDVLLGQDVFLPYSPVAQTLQRGLFGVTAASRTAGYPLKVALIASTSDLGVVPALFGRPSSYARFLSSELASAAGGPVLVVMPAGLGLADRGKQLSTHALSGLGIAPGGDGLAVAAISAVSRLAAAAGHPLPASVGATGIDTAASGASPATVRHALSASAVLAALACVGIVGAFILRARRRQDLTP